jgi:MoaA/NifB/PqqE/SkfB family radical SAM enzyme
MYLHYGFVTTCCTNWLDWRSWSSKPNGYALSPHELWRSSKLEKFRKKIANGDYSACRSCPVYLNKTNILTGEESWRDDVDTDVEWGPSVLYITDSFVCNLKCWSCRTTMITEDEHAERKQRLLWRVMDKFGRNLRLIGLLGCGELFASPRHLDFLRECRWGDYPDIELELVSNGLLLEKGWSRIAPAHGSVRYMSISVDAATRGTYEVVREGAEWDRLVGGLQFARSLPIEKLQVTFVVRRANVQEMAQFATEMLGLGVDEVLFIQLAPSYLRREEYAAENVCDPAHPDRQFLAQLDGPVFRDERVKVLTYFRLVKI